MDTVRTARIPGFTAESSLQPVSGAYRESAATKTSPASDRSAVQPAAEIVYGPNHTGFCCEFHYVGNKSWYTCDPCFSY
jgi:hypothetical protein